MRLAAYPLAARVGPGAVGAPAVLAMATTGGATAAGTGGLGAIVVGGRADVVVLDPTSPSLTPSYDARSTVAYAASRADVRWVVAAGRVVLDDHRLTTVDVNGAVDALRDMAPRILAVTSG
jgi:5-methylthioadenosine/S-adenosylhomocysteine deaminase